MTEPQGVGFAVEALIEMWGSELVLWFGFSVVLGLFVRLFFLIHSMNRCIVFLLGC